MWIIASISLMASSNAPSCRTTTSASFRNYGIKEKDTFAISSITTMSILSRYPRDVKYSIICVPLSRERTVPRTENPLSRRLRTIHMAMNPFAPVTKTLSPLATAGMMAVWMRCVSLYKGKNTSGSRGKNDKENKTRSILSSTGIEDLSIKILVVSEKHDKDLFYMSIFGNLMSSQLCLQASSPSFIYTK